jgi:hypothetical protein
METVNTILYAYTFETDKHVDREAYAALVKRLRAQGLRMFKSHGGAGDTHSAVGRKLDGQTIALETAHLYDNQWNSAPIPGINEQGVRLFDWAENAIWLGNRENKTLKTGYYLEQTPGMIAARAERVACRYCGKQYQAPTAPTFCTACRGSPYLTEKDLPLLRLVPVSTPFGTRIAPLTDEEREELMRSYTAEQITGRAARDAAEREAIRAKVAGKIAEATRKADRLIRSARVEQHGLEWLLARDMYGLIDNVIFYNHTGRFGFGWRKPLDKARTDALLDAISEFPYPYDIETEHRGRLSSAEGESALD